MSRRHAALAAFVVVCLSLVPDGSAQPRGSASFERYFVIGDSLSAGFTNGTLLERYQKSSFPALLARQAGAATFRQPLVGEPGLVGELTLVRFNPLDIQRKSGLGRVIGGSSAEPYNNLAVPIATVGDLLAISGLDSTNNRYYDEILGRHGTAVEQMLEEDPTFVTIWVGNRDALRGITSGLPHAMTPPDEFERDLRQLVSRIVSEAPAAGVVIANIPDLLRFPVATGVPPVVIHPTTGRPVLGADGRPVALLGEDGPLPSDALLNLGATRYLIRGAGIPAELAPLFDRPWVGGGLPTDVVLTPDEIAEVASTIDAYNDSIARVARDFSLPLVDMRAEFRRLGEGVVVGGVRFDMRLLFGGLIGLDGVNPTPLGNVFVANAFIRTINGAWGTEIEPVSIGRDFNPSPRRGHD